MVQQCSPYTFTTRDAGVQPESLLLGLVYVLLIIKVLLVTLYNVF